MGTYPPPPRPKGCSCRWLPSCGHHGGETHKWLYDGCFDQLPKERSNNSVNYHCGHREVPEVGRNEGSYMASAFLVPQTAEECRSLHTPCVPGVTLLGTKRSDGFIHAFSSAGYWKCR